MTILLFMLILVWFSIFFYIIDIKILSFLPLLFLLILLIWNISYVDWNSVQDKYLNEQNILKLSRICILIWTGFLMYLMNFEWNNIVLYLFIWNALLWIWSYFLNYKDWEDIFELWFFISWVSLVLYNWIISWNTWTRLSYFLIATTLIYAIIFFIIQNWYQIKKRYIYNIIIFFLISIYILLRINISDKYLVVSIFSIVLLSSILLIRYIILQNIPKQNKAITARDILEWKKVLEHKRQNHKTSVSPAIIDIVNNIPNWLKISIEILNWMILVMLIYNFIQSNISISSINHLIMFIITIFSFMLNIFLLRSIDYSSTLQRVLFFTWINVLVYIIIFSVLHSSLSEILFFTVLRNFFSWVAFSMTKQQVFNQLIKYKDYITWIICDIVFFAINVVIMIYIDASIKTKIALILIYAWFRWIVFIYQNKKIKTILNTEN